MTERGHTLRVVAPAEPATAPRPPPTDAEAKELVRRSAGGDMQAWGRLYQLHYHPLYRHVCYLTGDPQLSEDLTQETFARAQTSLARFAGRSTFSTWLHGIAINVVRKHRARRSKTQTTREGLGIESGAIPCGADLERDHLQKARATALYRVVDALPDHLRDAFVLRDLMGCTVPEAATQLAITEANLRVRACRARARVHDVLVAEGWIEPPKGGA